MFVNGANILTHLIIMAVLSVKGCILARKRRKVRTVIKRSRERHAKCMKKRKQRKERRLLAMGIDKDEVSAIVAREAASPIMKRRNKFMAFAEN